MLFNSTFQGEMKIWRFWIWGLEVSWDVFESFPYFKSVAIH